VVGVPRADVDHLVNAGAIVVLHGSADGLSTESGQYISLRTPGVLGVARKGAGFGHTLSVADFGGDGHDDVMIGAPYDRSYGHHAGYVMGLRGSAAGITADHFSWVVGMHPDEELGIVIA
jgi:hypothetical protein